MTVWVRIKGRERRVELRLAETAGRFSGPLACAVDGSPLALDVQTIEGGMLSILVDGRQWRCILDGDAVLIGGRRYEFEQVDRRSLGSRRASGDATGGAHAVKAPMPGRVVRLLVEVGDVVAAQQGLVVIEAMKMQNELKSPKAGTVTQIAVAAGDTVQAGTVLVVVG